MVSYRDYRSDGQKQRAKNIFLDGDFTATKILDNEEFLIFDWRERSGSGNLATRYILDKKKGNLIIAGDSGDCIASWYNEVAAKDMEAYVNSIGYFIEKMQCASDKYTYNYEDIEADLEKLRSEFESELLPEYLEGLGDEEAADVEDECREKLNRLTELLIDAPISDEQGVVPDTEAIEIIEDLFSSPWYESGFEGIGRRISNRVYLWSVGYQMGYAQIASDE